MSLDNIDFLFKKCSKDAILFTSKFKRVTYCSVLLVIEGEITSMESNKYNGWDDAFYKNGLYKDSLLIKMCLEMTKINKGEKRTILWDDALKTFKDNEIEKLRKESNIYHGVSFIYALTNNISVILSVCTGKNTPRDDFENFLLPIRSEFLQFFKGLM